MIAAAIAGVDESTAHLQDGSRIARNTLDIIRQVESRWCPATQSIDTSCRSNDKLPMSSDGPCQSSDDQSAGIIEAPSHKSYIATQSTSPANGDGPATNISGNDVETPRNVQVQSEQVDHTIASPGTIPTEVICGVTRIMDSDVDEALALTSAFDYRDRDVDGYAIDMIPEKLQPPTDSLEADTLLDIEASLRGDISRHDRDTPSPAQAPKTPNTPNTPKTPGRPDTPGFNAAIDVNPAAPTATVCTESVLVTSSQSVDQESPVEHSSLSCVSDRDHGVHRYDDTERLAPKSCACPGSSRPSLGSEPTADVNAQQEYDAGDDLGGVLATDAESNSQSSLFRALTTKRLIRTSRRSSWRPR